MSSFKANALDASIELLWTTESEQNNDYFVIEKSADATEWIAIGEMEGNGTASKRNDYSFLDKNPFSGINYYRLKQVDMDDRFQFSNIISTYFKNAEGIAVFPNPVQSKLTIQSQDEEISNFVIELLDVSGKIIFRRENENLNTEINFSNFENGIYFLKISDRLGEAILQERIIKF